MDNNRIGSPADSRVDNRDWSIKTGRVDKRIGPPAKMGTVRNRICPPASMESTTGLAHQQTEWATTRFTHQTAVADIAIEVISDFVLQTAVVDIAIETD